MSTTDALQPSQVMTGSAQSRAAAMPPGSRVSMALDLDAPIRFLLVCLGIVVVSGIARELVVGTIGTGTVLQDLRHFALDSERNLASWFEGICMAFAGALLAFNAVIARQTDRRNVIPWTILALVFMLMSLDEIVGFHEVSVKPLRHTLHLTGIFYYSWVLIAIPLVAALGLYLVPFLFRLPRITAYRFVAAGAIFVGAAVGTEFICGYLASNGGLDSVPYKITAAAQEILENTGMTLFVISLLKHIALTAPVLRINFLDR